MLLSKYIRSFWELLDSESVRLFIWPYYLALFAWGLYATIWAQPITVVEPVMGRAGYDLWVWIQMPATATALAGLAMRYDAPTITQMTGKQLFKDYIGLWMQLAGHICMFFVLLAYQTAIVVGGQWGAPVFSLFAVTPYVIGCFLLSLQCVRKIRLGLYIDKHTDNLAKTIHSTPADTGIVGILKNVGDEVDRHDP